MNKFVSFYVILAFQGIEIEFFLCIFAACSYRHMIFVGSIFHTNCDLEREREQTQISVGVCAL